MGKYITDERTGLKYELVGDYYLIAGDDEPEERPMAKQESVTAALKAADQMEWVRRKNSIRNRAEEIVLHELVYDQ